MKNFVSIRLGKDSVNDIKKICALPSGVLETPVEVDVTCTQIPSSLAKDNVAFIWLGSDNNKGAPTEWKQGFRAIGIVDGVVKGAKYNDESTTKVRIAYIFPDSVSRLDFLQNAPNSYFCCSALPVIGLDDHSNQTIRNFDESEKLSDVRAFFYSLYCVYRSFYKDIVSFDPSFKDYFKFRHPISKKEYEITEEECVYQKIVFGAPGTGKSYQLNLQANSFKRSVDWKFSFKEILGQYRTSGLNTCAYSSRIGNEFSISLTYYLRDHSQEELAREFGLSSTEKDWIALSSRGATIGMNDEDVDNAVKCEGIERVTFHPNYSYAQFVGTYKPAQDKDLGHEKEIVYKYVPGPFMRILVKALNNPQKDFLLIIEEINRANVAAVFGDVFQLLDRKNGVSEYPVAASEDIKRYLKDNGIADCNELKIPSNMYIWATMNSADQGVFPMDTAFKRRWEFEYIGVDDNQQTIENFEIPMQKNADGSHEWMKWNELRTKINDKLTDLGINEDKLLGPFFISLEKLQSVDNHNESEAENFVKAFKSKVLMYLFEDAVKMKATSFFKCDKMRYSEICKKFDTDGIEVFNF